MHRYRRRQGNLSARDRLAIRAETQEPIIDEIVYVHLGKRLHELGINWHPFLEAHDPHTNAWAIIRHVKGEAPVNGG